MELRLGLGFGGFADFGDLVGCDVWVLCGVWLGLVICGLYLGFWVLGWWTWWLDLVLVGAAWVFVSV